MYWRTINNYFYDTEYQRFGKTIGDVSYLYVFKDNIEYMFLLDFFNGTVNYDEKYINLSYIKNKLYL
jgi:hypothetical protein